MSSGDDKRGVEKLRTIVRGFLMKIAERQYYRVVAQVASLLLFAIVVFPALGGNFPLLQQAPEWAVRAVLYVLIALLIPLIVYVFESQREVNLRRYDPESPEIRESIGRWRRVGWSAVAITILALSLLILFIGRLAEFPIWLAVMLIIVPLGVGVFAFQRAAWMKEGFWSPPEWMPPMNPSEGENEDSSRDN